MGGQPAAANRIDRLSAALASYADTSNPLTVRLLRQQARSLTLAIVLHLLLLAGVAATVAVGMISPEKLSHPRIPLLRSEMLFLCLVTVWTAVAWIVQPVMFASLVRQERDEATWDLLNLTGLPPLRIVGGLVVAAAIQQFLLLTVMAPFLVMAWMLNGLDPFVLLLAALVIPLNGLVTVCVSIKATLSGKNGAIAARPGRTAIGASLAWLLVIFLFWMFTMSGGFIPGFSSLRALSDTALVTILVLANLGLHLGAIAMVDAAMRVTHPAANRSTAPRVLVLAFLANLVLVLLGLTLAGTIDWLEMLAWLAAITAACNVFSSIDGFAEPYSLTSRQARACAPPGSLRRFLDPGATAARRFHLLLALPALAIGVVMWIVGFGDIIGGIGAVTVGLVCYGALVLVIADTLARGGESGRSRPQHHRRWVWGYLIISTIGSGFFSAMSSGSFILGSISPLFGLIPFWMAGAGHVRQDSLAVVILVGLAGVCALVAVAMQANHPSEIRPLRGEPT